ncbi:Rieske (2Fe-2S) protein [Streptomyces sp. NPDC021020]|uniref:Rieske (2Fe-2S) protein n=1 Tax=Streptomyces sp. NPDC021020 TaxID=3365109 RepID=UPI0037B3F01E
MPETPGLPLTPTRRAVVAAAGGAGLAAVLTACGSDADSGSASDAPASDGSGGGSAAASSPADSGSGGGGDVLAKTSDIPVGGGKVFADQKVVVTQPTAGQFKGFSAVCTHQGCTVIDVSGGTINCPCHGSKFKVEDGSVAHGPATSPLPAKAVAVSGDGITLA